ncbi:hypothetical protein [Ureibacillus aquaedulcis]|uniref:AhpC/TSA family protein n=1 Tax=Ureibacillus aquaedulcis TaxID=3058421 RepID=A0ABT8GSG1_9BACL|nr:hypothetical protein [Ureibacillus sp. BA0131]MDN4494348.1 hypothetical protein [Ureibacillus sp. BA0131]
MKKFLIGINFVLALFLFIGCSNQEKTIEGEFLLGKFGADPIKSPGIYAEPNLGIVTSINNLEIKAEGKIVVLLYFMM